MRRSAEIDEVNFAQRSNTQRRILFLKYMGREHIARRCISFVIETIHELRQLTVNAIDYTCSCMPIIWVGVDVESFVQRRLLGWFLSLSLCHLMLSRAFGLVIECKLSIVLRSLPITYHYSDWSPWPHVKCKQSEISLRSNKISYKTSSAKCLSFVGYFLLLWSNVNVVLLWTICILMPQEFPYLWYSLKYFT